MDIITLKDLIENSEYLKFIEQNINEDIHILRLKKNPKLSFDSKFAILQIECRNSIKTKLPEIFGNNKFLFPNILSTEQCTAQKIAEFHATLLNSNDNVLDLTCGLCIDAYYISKKVNQVTAIEINHDISVIDTFNMQNMTDNVTVINQDCIDFIKDCNEFYDVIFIDPARRGDNNKRLFGFSDCLPNILELIPSLKNIGKYLFIKASPMIDISKAIIELNNCVSDVWVIGINNECKELLFKVDLTPKSEIIQPTIHTINFDNKHTQVLSYQKSSETECINNTNFLIDSDIYLYEPNSCIMKAGIFSTLSAVYNIFPIQHNSHLFLSNEIIHDFPGRKFKIDKVIPFKNKELKAIKKVHPQINVSVRNFKLSAEELKKKIGVKDGGDIYLFGTTDKNNNAILIICKKI